MISLGENVVGLLDSNLEADDNEEVEESLDNKDQILAAYEDAGFRANIVMCDPHHTGWPQTRKRVFFVALNKKSFKNSVVGMTRSWKSSWIGFS